MADPALFTPPARTGAGDETPESVLDKTEIERLGRERPALLAHWYTEVGFVIAIVMSMTMSEYFIGGFNIILPPLAEALDIPQSSRTWPAGVINLTTAALLMPFSRLCDLYGSRSVFLAGHAWLALWSLVCGFSRNGVMLILCRAMQGIGASAFTPAGLAILGQTYRPGPRKNLVFAVWGAFACLGFYFGIFMGAVCAEFLDWRWYFWIGAVIVAAVAATGFLTIPRRGLHEPDPAMRMDWWGVFTIVPGLVLVVYAFTDGGQAPRGWQTPYIYVAFALGVLFLAAGVYVQGWVSAQPLLPADLFRPKYMKRLSASLFCSYGVFGLFLFYSSYYLETVLHTSPIQTAAWFTPLAVGGIFLAIGGGFVLHLVSNRVLMMVSGVGFLISVLLFAFIPEQTGGQPSNRFLYWAYVFPAMLCGTIGVDITYNVTNVFITTAMPRRHQAAASGLINSLLYLGLAFWLGISELAVSQAVAAASAKGQGDGNGDGGGLSLREQYRIGFWMGVGLAVLSLLLTSTVRMGQASSAMTADEKAELERELPAPS